MEKIKQKKKKKKKKITFMYIYIYIYKTWIIILPVEVMLTSYHYCHNNSRECIYVKVI